MLIDLQSADDYTSDSTCDSSSSSDSASDYSASDSSSSSDSTSDSPLSETEIQGSDGDHNEAAYLRLPPYPFSHNPATQQRQPGPNLIRLAGKADIYSWSNHRHQCQHHQNSDVPRTALVNSTCAVLSFFNGMYFCPLVNSIICPQHRSVIVDEELLAHWTKHHKVALGRSGSNHALLLSHIRSALLTAPTKTVDEVISIAATLELSEPIPGLTPPELCVQCPNCSRWFISRDESPGRCLHKHWRRSQSGCRDWHDRQPKTYRASRLPRVYASALFIDSTRSGFRVTFHSDFKPCSLASSDPSPPEKQVDTTLQSPQYLTDLGWTPYVESLSVDPSILIQLVALPSPRMSGSWPEGSEGYHIEEGLRVLYNFFGQYLRDANTRVNSCNDAVRDALVAG